MLQLINEMIAPSAKQSSELREEVQQEDEEL